MRRKGGGARRLYRIVDFKRNKLDMPATVERIEYDPNRTAFIALIKYEDGQHAYILHHSVWLLVTKLFQVQKPMLNLVTLCRSLVYQSVQSSTTSS